MEEYHGREFSEVLGMVSKVLRLVSEVLGLVSEVLVLGRDLGVRT